MHVLKMAQHVKVVTADGAAKKGALMFASTGTPRKQLIIRRVMQTVQFLAWFFKTKLDNMSGCAAFHHSLAEERIGNGIGGNSIGLLLQNRGMTYSSDTHAWSQTQNVMEILSFKVSFGSRQQTLNSEL